MKLPPWLPVSPLRLSRREQILIGVALVAGFAMAALYLVRFPGEAAARSAANRNLLAARELAEARTLAASSVTTSTTGAALLERLQALAATHGVAILGSRASDGVLVLQIMSPDSRQALAWAADASATAAPLRSLSIAPGDDAQLAIEAAFAGAS